MKTEEQPKAIIFVDGEEFMRVFDGDPREMYDETMKRIPQDFPGRHEYALSVWKPKYNMYFRERLDIR